MCEKKGGFLKKGQKKKDSTLEGGQPKRTPLVEGKRDSTNVRAEKAGGREVLEKS